MVRPALPMNEPAPVEKDRLKSSVSWTAQSVERRSDHRCVILGCPCCRRRRYHVIRSSTLRLTRPWLSQRRQPERR